MDEMPTTPSQGAETLHGAFPPPLTCSLVEELAVLVFKACVGGTHFPCREYMLSNMHGLSDCKENCFQHPGSPFGGAQEEAHSH